MVAQRSRSVPHSSRYSGGCPWQGLGVEPVEITAGRLHLRAWRPEDVPDLVRACSDPLVQRWTRVPVPYTAADAAAHVTGSARGWQTGRDLRWAVCDSPTGAVLASVALRTGPTDGIRELGCWAAAAARGRGVVPQAVGVVCRWAFAQPELAVHRVEWMAGRTNWASRRAAEKAGFTGEGVLRAGREQRGRPIDAWLAARLPGDPDRDTAVLPPLGRPTDGVVALRRWTQDDVEVVRRACDDPETARQLPVPAPYTLAVARRWLLEEVPQAWFEGTRADVAVADDRTGEVLGAVGLALGARASGAAEVGYWTVPGARGRGVAGRAAALLSRWGFAALGLARVELLAAVDNPASQRTADKAGFVREGVARGARPHRDGTRRDMVVFARVAGD